jgi:TPR repeat protein
MLKAWSFHADKLSRRNATDIADHRSPCTHNRIASNLFVVCLEELLFIVYGIAVFCFAFQLSFLVLNMLAKAGNVWSQARLGSHYFTGKFLRQDQAKAVFWWRKAAERGDSKAQYSLAWAYANGHGVTQDDVEACFWYDRVLASGKLDGDSQVSAIEFRASSASRLDTLVFAQEQELAAQCLLRQFPADKAA